MAHPTHIVWTWVNEAGEPVYVGWGSSYGGTHPADRLFAEAKDRAPSSLTVWLGCHEQQPKRIDHGIFPRFVARSIANARRAFYRRRRQRLLSSKPFEKCIGGGSSRHVVDPRGVIYSSVRLAADTYHVNPSTVLRWCRKNHRGWKYHQETSVCEL